MFKHDQVHKYFRMMNYLRCFEPCFIQLQIIHAIHAYNNLKKRHLWSLEAEVNMNQNILHAAVLTWVEA